MLVKAVTFATILFFIQYASLEPGAVAKPSEIECGSKTADTHPEMLEADCTRVLERPDLTAEERAEAFYLRGFGRLYAGQYETAAEDFDKGLALAPDHNRLHRQRGWVALKQVDLERAFHHARRAIELYPQGSEEYFLLGQIYLRVRENDKALESFNRAIELKDGHIWSRHERAVIYLENGNYKKALEDTEWLMKIEPDVLDRLGKSFLFTRYVSLYFAVHARHAFVLAGLGRFKEGERVVTDLTNRRRSAFTLVVRAEYLSQIPLGMGAPSRLLEAIRDLEAAVVLDPKFSFAWRSLAIDLHLASRLEEAFAANELALRTNRVPAYVPYMIWERARMLRSQSKTQEASQLGITAMQLAIEMEPRFVADFIERLRDRGYWQSTELPSHLTQNVIDATTACFHDPACI